jgi:hypothetical protein
MKKVSSSGRSFVFAFHRLREGDTTLPLENLSSDL